MKNKDLVLSNDNFDLDNFYPNIFSNNFFLDLDRNNLKGRQEEIKSFSSFQLFENGKLKNKEEKGFFFLNNNGEGFIKTFENKNGKILTNEKNLKKNKIKNK